MLTTLSSGVPGPKFPVTPDFSSDFLSSSGIVPPPTTRTSLILLFFYSLTTLGNSVPCAPFNRLSATTSTSSSSAICAILSGVAKRPE